MPLEQVQQTAEKSEHLVKEDRGNQAQEKRRKQKMRKGSARRAPRTTRKKRETESCAAGQIDRTEIRVTHTKIAEVFLLLSFLCFRFSGVAMFVSVHELPFSEGRLPHARV